MHIWFVFTSFHILTGACFRHQRNISRSSFFFFGLGDRLSPSCFFHNNYCFSWLKLLLIVISFLFKNKPVYLYLPHISNSQFNYFIRLLFRLLSPYLSIFIFSDGLSGFLNHSYALSSSPVLSLLSYKTINWDLPSNSNFFSNSILLNPTLTASIKPRRSVDYQKSLSFVESIRHKSVSLFIESFAIDLPSLLQQFHSDPSLSKLVCRHSKHSVSSIFSSVRYEPYIEQLSSNSYPSLELFILSVLKNCSSLTIYSGACSTTLFILSVVEKFCPTLTLQVRYSPKLPMLGTKKYNQTRDFYTTLSRSPRSLLLS